MRNLDSIPDPPTWWTKEALIPAIMEHTPVQFVIDHSSMIRACYDDGWNREALQKFTEYDLVKILGYAQITQDQVPKEE